MRTSIAALALVAMVGCGGGITKAREWVNLAALAGEEVDRVLAVEYAHEAERALEATLSYMAYKEWMRPWDAAVDAVDTLREGLQLAWLALAAAEAGYDADYRCALERLSGAVRALHAALVSIGVDIPQELEYVLVISDNFDGGYCDA